MRRLVGGFKLTAGLQLWARGMQSPPLPDGEHVSAASPSPPPPPSSEPAVTETPEATVLFEHTTTSTAKVVDEDEVTISGITRKSVHVVSPAENVKLEVSKLHAMFSQDGPYLGAKNKDRERYKVDERRRRDIVRVPQKEMDYVPNETSFRRIPYHIRLPNEFQLRNMYPQSTGLEIIVSQAHCVDASAIDPDEAPMPMTFSMLVPPNYDPKQCYPHMVVIPDGSGFARDFEDVCANLFEQPVHQELMRDQEWVIMCPVVNLKHNYQVPVEAIVARFCDWVAEAHNVENGKVHLFGKGNGAYVALRTVLDHREVALSITAVLGRPGTPFRSHERPQSKAHNYDGVHSLCYVPGLLRKQDWHYKMKLMLDLAKVNPPMRNIHFADVADHQVYYAINPYEFWAHMRYFRQYNLKQITQG